MDANSTKRQRIVAFLSIARKERGAAERLAEEFPGQAMFFAQQAVEKIARACLEGEEIPASRTHGLAALAMLLPAGHPFRDRLRDLDDLSTAATRYRYPSAYGREFETKPGEILPLLKTIGDLERDAAAYLITKTEG